MLNINVTVDNINYLHNLTKTINKMSKNDISIKWNKKLKEKVLQTLEEVMNKRLGSHSTTNDEFISLYKANNHIKDTKNGFILYNNATIPVSDSLVNKYPNGKFSIALAFEYGVGIVGEGTYDGDYFKPWEYNVNHYNFGWQYKKNDGTYDTTYGYMGFEIYRYLIVEVKKNMNNWYKEFLEEMKIK